MEPIRASIEVRASIDEALRRWSDPCSVRPRQVEFESVAPAESRVTVEAYDSWLDAGVVQRELERHLSAFKGLVEARVPAPALGCHEHR